MGVKLRKHAMVLTIRTPESREPMIIIHTVFLEIPCKAVRSSTSMIHGVRATIHSKTNLEQCEVMLETPYMMMGHRWIIYDSRGRAPLNRVAGPVV